jgi:hypothetical protein
MSNRSDPSIERVAQDRLEACLTMVNQASLPDRNGLGLQGEVSRWIGTDRLEACLTMVNQASLPDRNGLGLQGEVSR